MNQTLLAAFALAAFLAGGGGAMAGFIRYVAAPAYAVQTEPAPATATAGTWASQPAAPKPAPCSAKTAVCDAAFAAFMLQAVLSAKPTGGADLDDLRRAAADKLRR